MEPVDHGGQCIGLGAVVSFASLAAMPYQPGVLEDGEMLGNGGLRYARVARQCVDGLLAVAGELLKNGGDGWDRQGHETPDWRAGFTLKNHNHAVSGLSRGSDRT